MHDIDPCLCVNTTYIPRWQGITTWRTLQGDTFQPSQANWREISLPPQHSCVCSLTIHPTRSPGSDRSSPREYRHALAEEPDSSLASFHLPSASCRESEGRRVLCAGASAQAAPVRSVTHLPLEYSTVPLCSELPEHCPSVVHR